VNALALASRERDDVDALVTDRYLETLLAAGDRRAADAPADADLDPDVRAAALVLRRVMVRVHPSFRFEERLAARLAGMAAQARPAAQMQPAAASAAAFGTVLAFPGAACAGRPGGSVSPTGAGRPDGAADPLLGAILCGDLDPSDAGAVARADRTPGPRRPLIVGGAITSAAISIAGVAWVAWRASHPAEGAIARAARTARSRRGAAVALPGGGLGGPA
jgi:hypothetical protein